jgi:hypothetical protein
MWARRSRDSACLFAPLDVNHPQFTPPLGLRIRVHSLWHPSSAPGLDGESVRIFRCLLLTLMCIQAVLSAPKAKGSRRERGRRFVPLPFVQSAHCHQRSKSQSALRDHKSDRFCCQFYDSSAYLGW